MRSNHQVGRDQGEVYLGSNRASDTMRNMIARRRRWTRSVLVVLLAAASVGVYTIRRPILRAAGWALVVNEQVESADVIVVAVDVDGAGVIEASDLIHSGMARRVAIFTGTPDPVGSGFIRRGVPYEDEAARSVRQLRSLGVETIDLIPGSVLGTDDEGPVLADWCKGSAQSLL
jgi:hypothetical protein